MMNLSRDSFDAEASQENGFRAPGVIHNMNTKEQFQAIDKNAFLRDAAKVLYEKLRLKEVLSDPTQLAAFSILSFSDLKSFKFFYWFAFPSLYTEWEIDEIRPASDNDTKNIALWLESGSLPFFILNASNVPFSLEELVLDDKRNNSIRVGIIDASTYENIPAWYARNFLTALLSYGYSSVHMLVYRANGLSFWAHVHASSKSVQENVRENCPRSTGWEKTSAGALQPKMADLKSLISPTALAEQAVDLNLKLMKWRIVPQIDLDVVRESKCLLLGAGTLGSYVARALLGWGVRKITFVDNGKVSFSNPVRQSLYNYEDCLNGGAPKAEAAAESAKRIFPQVDAQGVTLEVPMIGHPVKDPEREKAAFETLERLVDEHDVIFLLMDLRETRWLPTVLGSAKDKLVINAALGFDSFLVMRHGSNQHLGCYFCNDVVAPKDSLTDRTLDQMCTVTRPGGALAASALAVELAVLVLQHPKRQAAAASDTNILGGIPHQIRGFLHDFNNVCVSAPGYPQCSACSSKVVDEYRQRGWEFVQDALNDSKYVEELSGLAKVQAEAEKAAMELEMGAFDVEDAGSIDEEWL